MLCNATNMSRSSSDKARQTEAVYKKLVAGFRRPPDDCRLFVRWVWFGPAVTKEELGRELEMMQAAGVGGVEIMSIYPLSRDDPAKGIRNLEYLSPEFLEAIGYVAAKADELGLDVDVTLTSGWPYGGPHITPELESRCIRCHTQQVYCRAGGTVPSEVRLPPLGAYDKLIAALAVRRIEEDELDPSSVVDLTDRIAKNKFTGSLADGSWDVMTFFESPRRYNVKRPSLGAEGYVLNHLDRHALAKHLETVGAPIISSAKGKLRAAFCDSLEVLGANWTSEFLAEFRKRRGYDLKTWLPALWMEFGENTAQIRIDYRRTISDLAIDEFIKPLADWCKKNGIRSRAQIYGTPAIDLAGYSHLDFPEGEIWWFAFGEQYDAETGVIPTETYLTVDPVDGTIGTGAISATRWASSAAHLYGKQVCSAETFTWLRKARFLASLQDLKVGADIYFLHGINSIIAASYPYSPPEVGVPGWTSYWGPSIYHNNTWWRDFPLLSSYIQRASYILRQGTPVVDIAVYAPVNDMWASSSGDGLVFLPWNLKEHLKEELTKQILTNGYNFDLITDDALVHQAAVENGQLTVNGMRYSVIVLPDVSYVPAESMEKLRSFCKSGGTLIAMGSLPRYACGSIDNDRDTRAVRKIVHEIFGAGRGESRTSSNRFGEGAAYQLGYDGEALTATLLASCSPDVGFPEPQSHMGFVHRRISNLHIYFLANTSSEDIRVRPTFRVGHKVPEIWNPATGETRPAYVYSFAPGATEVPVALGPFESRVLLFGQDEASACHLSDTNLCEITGIQETDGGVVVQGTVDRNGRYFVQTGERKTETTVENVPDSIPVSNSWKVTFDADPEESKTMPNLRSWTEYPEYAYFSGRATYVTKVMVPAECIASDIELYLDLGEVRETAEVYVNGIRIGVSWKAPHVLGITHAVKKGDNKLEITATNLLINLALGKGDPDYQALNAQYGPRFPPPEEIAVTRWVTNPLPSGLLGPVRVTASRIIQLDVPNRI